MCFVSALLPTEKVIYHVLETFFMQMFAKPV